MTLEVVHYGFDGLDLAIRAQIPPELELELADAKEEAQRRRALVPLKTAAGYILVRESGATGGYTYSCEIPSSGNWFFKKPNPSDPWGVRFSAASGALLGLGHEGLRQKIAETCEMLGIFVSPDAYRISRVDFAVDFLAPDFTVNPKHFVVHARTSKNAISDLGPTIATHSKSSRNTSVTVGKMPGRQVIVYDKRAEVIAKHKSEWPEVWGRNLNSANAAPLDLSDRQKSQVWRIELRAGKRCLKDTWHVEGWQSYYDQLPKVFASLLDDVRYCTPNGDSNRARWPVHPAWSKVGSILSDHLFDYVPKLEIEEYREVKAEQKRDELLTQAFGLLLSAAALSNIKESELTEFAKNTVSRLILDTNATRRPTAKRLSEAAVRYAYLIP